MTKLYHYIHCPFCIRVRLALGLLNIPYESIVLAYDNEEAPLALSGKKMLPIFDDGRGLILNESLDIIKHIDKNNLLNATEIIETKSFTLMNTYLDQLGKNIHNLAMPYWIWTKEFNEESRNYFQSKKELKRGPFEELVKKRTEYTSQLMLSLSKLDGKFSPYFENAEIQLYDIILASHLWGMYIVPEFQFPDYIHSYLQKVATKCSFNYHEDFWR